MFATIRGVTTVERVARNVRDLGRASLSATERRRLWRRYTYAGMRAAAPYVGVDGDEGIVFAATADRTVGKYVYMDGDWSPDTLPTALRLAGVDLTGRTFVEVGANIGTTTLAAAKLAGHVVALEPEPLNYRLLRANVAVNLLDDRVTCINAGCGAEPGTVRMSRSSLNWGDHRVTDTGDVEVRAVRLDDALTESGREWSEVGMVWVDVQGYEAQVLQGSPRMLAAGVPLVTEFWPPVLGGANTDVVCDLLAAAYSQVIDLKDGVPTTMPQARRRWADGMTDLLCLP